MRIAISSAPAVGIEGAVQKIAAEKNLAIVRDPAIAACREYGFQTLYEMPEELQRTIRLRLIDEHREYLVNGGAAVFDHSVFGWVADWMRWFWSNTRTLDWERVWERARECARLYDEIYHVEGDVTRPYDGYYWLDRANSIQVNRLLRMLHSEFDVTGRVIHLTI